MANKYVNGSTASVIREMQVQITIRYHSMLTRVASIFKKYWKTTNGEKVAPQNVKHSVTIKLSNSTSMCIPKRIENICPCKIFFHAMFIEALLIVSKE